MTTVRLVLALGARGLTHLIITARNQTQVSLRCDMNAYLRSVIAGSGPTKSMTLCLAATLAICFIVAAHGQVVTARPELLSGPWELASPSGVDAIFVMIGQGTTGGITRKTIQVRVYHRQDGHETGGWYVVSPPPNAAAEFDGRRLRVGGLTATFDQEAARWTGTWSLNGQTREVVLERPHPANGVTLNPLCGEWEALPAVTPGLPSTSIRIHIVQSSDGAVTAWMDSGRVIIAQRVEDHRYGRSLKVISADPMSVILQNQSTGNFQVSFNLFSGVLSDDANTITGRWNDRPARQTFRRIP